MGRIADTLADEAVRRGLPVRFERLETRGRQPLAHPPGR